jgi:hypothetical protein
MEGIQLIHSGTHGFGREKEDFDLPLAITFSKIQGIKGHEAGNFTGVQRYVKNGLMPWSAAKFSGSEIFSLFLDRYQNIEVTAIGVSPRPGFPFKRSSEGRSLFTGN